MLMFILGNCLSVNIEFVRPPLFGQKIGDLKKIAHILPTLKAFKMYLITYADMLAYAFLIVFLYCFYLSSYLFYVIFTVLFGYFSCYGP